MEHKLTGIFNWRLFLSTLGVVFISEMGDKTQITTMLLAGAKPAYVLWVALGSAMALICTSFIEVIIGSQVIARYIKPETIKLLSGITFLILGTLLVFGLMGNVELNL
ncbi:TMEM165/GDT1 family protein [Desulfolucanica intricata]|uniref:TMEM165/GDT1 family protein n=1 Tax=Desulfolucanica intricata TaxID=1285191 RepID=UPI00350E5697